MSAPTFHRMLLEVLDRYPRRTLYVDSDEPDLAGEHVDNVLRLATGLAGMLRPHDRIAIIADAGLPVVRVFHAAALGSFVAVPLNPRLNEVELAALLADCSPRAVVTDGAHLTHVTAALRAAGLAPVLLLADHADGGLRLDDVIGASDPRTPPEPDGTTPALMLYTGGTTGRPRGAVATHRQLAAVIRRNESTFRIETAGSCLLSVNPLFHIAALNAVFAFPACAGTVVVRPTLDVDRVMGDVRRYAVTHLGAVVAILQRIVGHPQLDREAFESVRVVLYGAAPMPEAVLGQVRDAFPKAAIQQNYGMTETFGSVTCLDDADHRRGGARLASVGRPVPGVTVSIRDAHGAQVPSGTVGEIWLRTDYMCTRYWNDPAPARSDWLHTGDAGYLDPEGYLFLADRLKDMVKTGGENVYSVEVERALIEHPDIDAVAVIGLPDPQWGERVHAEIVPRPGSRLTADEVLSFARQRLSHFKAPKTVTVRSTPLPVSAVGKVLKREIRAQLVAQAGGAAVQASSRTASANNSA